MRKLCLLLLVCAACGTKKPAAKPSAQPQPPPTEEPGKKSDEPKPAPTAVPRTGDPCDGGQAPH